ncbi:hypothetical protein BVX93_00715, partial [bacterium B13(2017)]
YITKADIFNKAYGAFENCASHHSTFGGNSLCCKAALKALDLLSSPELIKSVKENGSYFLIKLKENFKGNALINEIRGQGLLIGIDFNEVTHPWLSWENLGIKDFAGSNPIPSIIMKQLLSKGFITNVCGHNWNVLKIEPPLTINKNNIDDFIDTLKESINYINGLT